MIEVTAGALKSGNTSSCGCWRRDNNIETWTKHGHSPQGNHSPTYTSWYGMIQRCRNPKNKCYKNYGGAGVEVCSRWEPRKGGSFVNFLKDMGERPKETVLGRREDIGNYCLENCSWQTKEEDVQTRRNKRKR